MTALVTDAAGGFRKNIRQSIRKRVDGIDLAADVDAAIAVNVGDATKTTVSRSVHRTAITQPQRGRPAAEAPTVDSPPTDRRTT